MFVYTYIVKGGKSMELLKNKCVILVAIMILGVSYLNALDNIKLKEASTNKEIISENR